MLEIYATGSVLTFISVPIWGITIGKDSMSMNPSTAILLGALFGAVWIVVMPILIFQAVAPLFDHDCRPWENTDD